MVVDDADDVFDIEPLDARSVEMRRSISPSRKAFRFARRSTLSISPR
jgi:hypothetical protein